MPGLARTVRDRLVLTSEARAACSAGGADAVSRFDIARNDPRGKGIDPVIAATLALLPDPNNFDSGDGLNSGGFRFNNIADVTMNSGILRWINLTPSGDCSSVIPFAGTHS
jgi:hypothetical protein